MRTRLDQLGNNWPTSAKCDWSDEDTSLAEIVITNSRVQEPFRFSAQTAFALVEVQHRARRVPARNEDDDQNTEQPADRSEGASSSLSDECDTPINFILSPPYSS